jgi:hypothetical protein
MSVSSLKTGKEKQMEQGFEGAFCKNDRNRRPGQDRTCRPHVFRALWGMGSRYLQKWCPMDLWFLGSSMCFLAQCPAPASPRMLWSKEDGFENQTDMNSTPISQLCGLRSVT